MLNAFSPVCIEELSEEGKDTKSVPYRCLHSNLVCDMLERTPLNTFWNQMLTKTLILRDKEEVLQQARRHCLLGDWYFLCLKSRKTNYVSRAACRTSTLFCLDLVIIIIIIIIMFLKG